MLASVTTLKYRESANVRTVRLLMLNTLQIGPGVKRMQPH